MTEDNETLIASSKNVSQLHKLAANTPNIVPALLDSVAPVKILFSKGFSYMVEILLCLRQPLKED